MSSTSTVARAGRRGGWRRRGDERAHPRRRRSRPTMADVGRAAGVSPSTVSFVLNDRREMGISAAAGCASSSRPPSSATAPTGTPGRCANETRTVGFVTDEIGVDPPAGQTIAGVHDVARTYDSVPLIVHATRDVEVSAPRVGPPRTAGRRPRLRRGRNRGRAILRPRPMVLVNCLTADHSLPSVLPAESRAAGTRRRRLLAAGHRRARSSPVTRPPGRPSSGCAGSAPPCGRPDWTPRT